MHEGSLRNPGIVRAVLRLSSVVEPRNHVSTIGDGLANHKKTTFQRQVVSTVGCTKSWMGTEKAGQLAVQPPRFVRQVHRQVRVRYRVSIPKWVCSTNAAQAAALPTLCCLVMVAAGKPLV